MSDPMYFAIIGDIIASRTLKDRDAVQAQMTQVLRSVNERFKSELAARFLVTLGDEFQGLLLAEPDMIFGPVAIAVRIINAMHPVKLRVGIGLGRISTRIIPDGAIGADGEAFYNARRCIDQMRAAQRRSDCSQVRFCSDDGALDERVNVPLMLMEALRSGWTQRQTELASAVVDAEMDGIAITQKGIAKRFGITQGTVSISLNSSCCFEYAAGLRHSSRQLRERLACLGRGN